MRHPCHSKARAPSCEHVSTCTEILHERMVSVHVDGSSESEVEGIGVLYSEYIFRLSKNEKKLSS